MNQDLLNHYTKGRTVGSKYNFDLEDLMKNFDFYDFCANSGEQDSNAFIVFTNHQYVMGYTAGFGEGSHVYAFARIYKELHGGGNISSEGEAINLSSLLQRDYLTVRVLCNETEGLNGKYHHGRLYFDTDSFFRRKPDITPSQYGQFLKFYEAYAGDIKRICEKYGMVVEFNSLEDGVIKRHTSKSLDEVATYLQSIAIAPEIENEEEVILNNKQHILG